MRDKTQPIFQAREGYRNRRLADLGRILPMVGLILFLLPLLWTGSGEDAGSTGSAGLFIFAAWLALIVAAASVSRWLAKLNEADAEEGGKGTDGSL